VPVLRVYGNTQVRLANRARG